MARVTRQGQKVSLGVFETAGDAAVAYAKHMREPPSVPAAPPTSGQAPAPPAGAATLGSSPSAARAVAVAVATTATATERAAQVGLVYNKYIPVVVVVVLFLLGMRVRFDTRFGERTMK